MQIANHGRSPLQKLLLLFFQSRLLLLQLFALLGVRVKFAHASVNVALGPNQPLRQRFAPFELCHNNVCASNSFFAARLPAPFAAAIVYELAFRCWCSSASLLGLACSTALASLPWWALHLLLHSQSWWGRLVRLVRWAGWAVRS